MTKTRITIQQANNLFSSGIVYSNMNNDHNSRFYLAAFYWGSNNINKNSIYNYTYEQQVQNLIADCNKFGVNYFFIRVDSFVKYPYQSVLNLKPTFILYCLNKIKSLTCIYIDTDIRMLKYPELFNTDNDIFVLNWFVTETDCISPYTYDIPGAILGFANNDETKKFLNNIIIHQPLTMEDKYLSMVLTGSFVAVSMRIMALPTTYLFMFLNHEYIPNYGYKNISTFDNELKLQGYTKNNIVFIHSDFETGELDDVYNSKIHIDRFPNRFNKIIGKKLRCVTKQLWYYRNFGLTRSQEDQFQSDNKMFKKKMIKRDIIPINSYTNLNIQKNVIKTYNGVTNIVITIIDSTTPKSKITKFEKKILKYGIKCIILKKNNSKPLNIPKLYYSILGGYLENEIVAFADINTKFTKEIRLVLMENNIDFCVRNSNASNRLNSKCFDPRVLNCTDIRSNTFIMLRNCNIVRQFLCIYSEFNKRIRDPIEALNTAFNKSMALSKMRCMWLSTNRNIKSKGFGKYIEQCGTKEELDDNNSSRKQHYHGSIHKHVERNFGFKI